MSGEPTMRMRIAPSGDLVAWDGTGLYPLELFPLDKQREITEAVASPTPPPRWLSLGLAEITSRAWVEWHLQRGIDPEKRREPIPQWMREVVIERDDYICQLCDGGAVDPDDVHIDHRHPVSLGGKTTVENLQVAHSLCNLRKGNRIT